MDVRVFEYPFRLPPLTSAIKDSPKEVEVGAHDAPHTLYGSDAATFMARNRALPEHI
jgi:hypothetical protein